MLLALRAHTLTRLGKRRASRARWDHTRTTLVKPDASCVLRGSLVGISLALSILIPALSVLLAPTRPQPAPRCARCARPAPTARPLERARTLPALWAGTLPARVKPSARLVPQVDTSRRRGPQSARSAPPGPTWPIPGSTTRVNVSNVLAASEALSLALQSA